MRSSKRAQAEPKDSSTFCLKFKTSILRLATLEIGKKFKQKLEHRFSQSPCILPMVLLYQCFATPIKENGNNFHRTVSSDILTMRRHAQVYSNFRRCRYGFSSPSPEKDCSLTMFIRHGRNSQPGVKIGLEDLGGSKRVLEGAAY